MSKVSVSMKTDGDNGNHLHGKWRYATPEEIDGFFDGLDGEDIIRYFE